MQIFNKFNRGKEKRENIESFCFFRPWTYKGKEGRRCHTQVFSKLWKVDVETFRSLRLLILTADQVTSLRHLVRPRVRKRNDKCSFAIFLIFLRYTNSRWSSVRSDVLSIVFTCEGVNCDDCPAAAEFIHRISKKTNHSKQINVPNN